jgi:signal peptidase complex subunit 3
MSHTFQHRLNALLTFAVSTLAVLCLLASITDEFHRSDPVADVRVLEIERFARVDRNDEAYLVFSVDADLRSCFSWNTKQLFVSVQAEYEIDHPRQGRLTNVVSIWDRVVESKEKAVLRVPRARTSTSSRIAATTCAACP